MQPSVENVEFFGDVYRVTRPGNTGDGSLKGFELGYQQFYDFLPGVLKGFGLQANYTYMDGDTTNVDTGVELPITGLSKQSFNIIGLYVRGAFEGRLAYNWRDEFLQTVNRGTWRNPIYVEPYDQIDLSVGYDITDNFAVSFEAINLTGEDVRWHGRSSKQLWRLEDQGARYALGARYKF